MLELKFKVGDRVRKTWGYRAIGYIIEVHPENLCFPYIARFRGCTAHFAEYELESVPRPKKKEA